MRHFYLLSLLIAFPIFINGQEPIEKIQDSADINADTKLTFYGMGYPMGVNDEVAKSLYINYQVADKLHIQLQHFYEKFGTIERAKTSFLFRYDINKKLHLFAGPENEYGFDNVTGKPEIIRINLNIGVGYEVNPNLLLELGYHRQLNAAPSKVYLTPARQNTFSLRARF